MRRRRNQYRRHSRVWDVLLTLVFFAILAVSVSLLNAYNPQVFDGNPVVVDGDTVIMQGEKLRLSGIDAPELGQMCQKQGKDYACGRQSRNALRTIMRNADAVCRSGGFDRYDRWLVECSADGQDVNAMMVSSGWAVDYGGYAAEESAAKRAKRGIWSGSFEHPQEFRHANRGDVKAVKGELGHGALGVRGMLQAVKSKILN